MIDTGRHTQPDAAEASMTVGEALEQAVQLHREGHLENAGKLYHLVMQTDPTNVDALHLSGVLAHQCGHHELAIELIGFAIDREPAIADFHNNLGEVHRALGDVTRADSCYQQALAIDADHCDAATNLAELAAESNAIAAVH